MAESRSSSAGASAGMPLREPRGSAEVEAAFAQLRALVAASGRSNREVAADADLKPPLLTKLLHPEQYPSRRDWSQVHAILVAAGADIDDYARAHGHLWGLEPSPEPSTPTPTPTPMSTSQEPAAALPVGGPVPDETNKTDETDPSIEWPGDDEPTMPVSDPPAPRVGSQHATREVDGRAATLRVPPEVITRVPPQVPMWVPSRVSPWVPPPVSAPSTFMARVLRPRGRRLSPRRGVVLAMTVVLVAVAVVAVARGWGSSQPPSGAVTAQEAPANAPELPELPDPLPAAPTALPELLNRPDVVSTVSVGPIAGFAALSPDGRTAYIAHRARGTISEIDTATNQVRTSYGVPAGPPQSLAVSPDGSWLYVSVYGRPAQAAPAAVAVLDARTRQQITAIPFTTRPFVSALAPDDRALWVPDHDTGTISVIDLTTNTIARRFEVSPNPHWIAFSSDGARAYTANHESNVIDVIDTATFARLTSIPVGTSPHSIALQPRGTLLAVAAYDTDGVDLVDTTTATRAATVPVGRNPNVVRWSPDGRLLYATVETEGRVAVIDPAARRLVGEVPVGRTPSSIALTPDGTRAYVTNLDDGTVSVLRTTQ